jgi:hypothetical protein
MAKRGNTGESGKVGSPDSTKEAKAIARAIKSAIRQIAIYDPELAEILEAEIRSGKTLSHIPRHK